MVFMLVSRLILQALGVPLIFFTIGDSTYIICIGIPLIFFHSD